MHKCKYCKEEVLYDQPHVAIDDNYKEFVHAPCLTERDRREFEDRCPLCNTDLGESKTEVCDKCNKLGLKKAVWIDYPGPNIKKS